MFNPFEDHAEIISKSQRFQKTLTLPTRKRVNVPRLIFIVGPTASGKSTIAAQFAKSHSKGKAFIFEFEKVPVDHFLSFTLLESILKDEIIQRRLDHDIIITLNPEHMTNDEINWMLQQIDNHVGTLRTSCICILNHWNWMSGDYIPSFSPNRTGLPNYNWDLFLKFTNSQKVLDRLPDYFSVRS